MAKKKWKAGDPFATLDHYAAKGAFGVACALGTTPLELYKSWCRTLRDAFGRSGAFRIDCSADMVDGAAALGLRRIYVAETSPIVWDPMSLDDCGDADLRLPYEVRIDGPPFQRAATVSCGQRLIRTVVSRLLVDLAAAVVSDARVGPFAKAAEAAGRVHRRTHATTLLADLRSTLRGGRLQLSCRFYHEFKTPAEIAAEYEDEPDVRDEEA